MNRRSLLIVAAAAGINNLIVPGPLLVIYISHLGAQVEQIGTVISLLIISATIAGFFGGTLGDIYGKRTILILALCFDFTGSITLVVCTFWTHALIAVIFKGIASGLFNPVLHALIAVLSSTQERGQSFGIVETVRRASYMVGPAVGGILAYQYGYNVMWLGVALSTLISLTCLLLLHMEAPQHTTELEPGKILRESYNKIKTTFKHPVAKLLLITAFVSTFAFSLVETYVPVHAKNIGANSAQIGLLGTAVGATFFFIYLGGRVSDSIKSIRRKIVLVSLLSALQFLTIFTVSITGNVYILIGIWFVVYAFHDLSSAPWFAVASGVVAPSLISTYFGASFTVSALGMSFGPQVGGLLWGLTSERILYGVSAIIGVAALIPYVVFVPRALSKGVPDEP